MYLMYTVYIIKHRGSMKKHIEIDDDLVDMIQDYANRNTNGNFTKGLDILCRGALLSDEFNFVLGKKDNRDKGVE